MFPSARACALCEESDLQPPRRRLCKEGLLQVVDQEASLAAAGSFGFRKSLRWSTVPRESICSCITVPNL